MVNSPSIRPYLLGGELGEGTLDSHDYPTLSTIYAVAVDFKKLSLDPHLKKQLENTTMNF